MYSGLLSREDYQQPYIDGLALHSKNVTRVSKSFISAGVRLKGGSA